MRSSYFKSLLGLLLVAAALLALPAGASAQMGSNPCTPEYQGSNICVVLDTATLVQTRAKWNGTYNANGCPIFVADNNIEDGNIVLGFNNGGQILTFNAPTKNNQTQNNGSTVGYRVRLVNGNTDHPTRLNIPYKTRAGDNPTVTFQEQLVSLTFANSNFDPGIDDFVNRMITRSDFLFSGVAQGDFVRNDLGVPTLC